jgi:hypothetical protein
MKASFRVSFISTADNVIRGEVRLEADIAFTPSQEIGFEHPGLGDEPRRPVAIGYDIESGKFDVYLGTVKRGTKEECRAEAESFARCGWKLSGFDA